MLKRFSSLCLLAVAAVGLVACGPPSLKEIESELTSPSATLDAKLIPAGYNSYTNGMVAVNTKVLGEHGKMVNFLRVGKKHKSNVVPMKDHLIQAGIPTKVVDQIMPYLPVKNDMTLKKEYTQNGEYGVLRQALPTGVCFNGRLTGLNGSFALEVDLDCLKIGTGSIYINAISDANLLGLDKDITFKLEVRFNNACDVDNNCIDGDMHYKVGALVGFGVSGAQLKLMLSMKLRVTPANGETVEVKQGVRVSFSTDTKTQKVEVVTYVRDEEKRERTLVLEVSASRELGTFAVRGKNGRYICSTSDRGVSGSCYAEGKKGTIVYQW